mgnify:CR=1 FL=1
MSSWPRSKNTFAYALGGLIAGHVGQRRVPVVARQDLVGALPGLHHLDRLADFLTDSR